MIDQLYIVAIVIIAIISACIYLYILPYFNPILDKYGYDNGNGDDGYDENSGYENSGYENSGYESRYENSETTASTN
jgi:hypothetical protein